MNCILCGLQMTRFETEKNPASLTKNYFRMLQQWTAFGLGCKWQVLKQIKFERPSLSITLTYCKNQLHSRRVANGLFWTIQMSSSLHQPLLWNTPEMNCFCGGLQMTRFETDKIQAPFTKHYFRVLQKWTAFRASCKWHVLKRTNVEHPSLSITLQFCRNEPLWGAGCKWHVFKWTNAELPPPNINSN